MLEEYAIESSISKVAGSETLDYCVDEARADFRRIWLSRGLSGGARYRDSRVNRIFEGTNEINRMLIIQMLMKRAMGGVLPLIPAAMKLSDEILAGPSFEEERVGRVCGRGTSRSRRPRRFSCWRRERRCRNSASNWPIIRKSWRRWRISRWTCTRWSRRCGARKRASAARGEAASVMCDAARAIIYDAMDRMEKDARTALAATADGDTLVTQLAVLRRFAKHAPLDTIAIRRRVADAVLAQDRYPFEGR